MTWKTQPRSKRGLISLIEKGNGPHILMLHGVGLCADAWNAQIEPLSEQYKISAPDIPGHGESDLLPMSSANLDDYVHVISPLITEPTVVIGHSMGAMTAVALAAKMPNVIGVAALNAIYNRTPDAHEAVKQRAKSLSTTEPNNHSPTLSRWFDDLNSEPAKACETWLRSVSPQGYKTAYSVFAQENGPNDALLRSLSCPALFMTGALEPNSTPEMSKAMAALSPNGQAIIIDHAAHMLPMTHASVVNHHLLSFMERCFA